MIGVFDSGLGGLTVLRAFLRRLPQYNYLYLGDNARAPYGNKSFDVIYEYTRQGVEFLFGRGCILIILACNTASAKALRKIQQEWLPSHYPERRVLGAVIPLAEVGVQVTRYGRIGVIGTRATIETKVYQQELDKLKGDLKVYDLACPLLVPLVEEGWVGRPETNRILKKYLRHLKDRKVDTLLPACTHYPFLQKDLERIMGKNCKVLNGPEIAADKLADYLHRHPEIETKVTRDGKVTCFTTDDPERFKLFGEKFLGQRIRQVEKLTFL